MAKLLISRGECQAAAPFASQALSRGRTFPALELAVITDAYGCGEVANLRPFWDDRIRRIANANHDPHALLESYILIGAILSKQEDLVPDFASSALHIGKNSEAGRFNLSLRAAVKSQASTGDLMQIEQMLPALLFNAETRAKFIDRVKELNLPAR